MTHTVASSHGYAPYEEAAARAQTRMTAAQRIGQILMGASQGLQASNSNASPFEAALQGFAGGYLGAQRSHQAAQEYAQKQVEAQQAREYQLIQQKHLEALTARESRPEKEAKQVETHAKPPWYLRPEWIDTPQGKAAQRKATHVAPGKEPKTPKPTVIKVRVPKGYSEQDYIGRIMQGPPEQPDQQEAWFQWVTGLVTGRGEADSDSIRRAASSVLRQIQSQRH